MNEVMSYLPVAIAIVGALAFVVSMIVEVIKNIPGLKQLPTDLVVLVLSIVLCVVAFLAYSSYIGMAITWYLIAGTIIAGFFVAFIAMYGWDKLKTLWERFN